MKRLHYTLTAAACALLAPPCIAQETQLGPDQYAATVRSPDLRPTTLSGARRTLNRIDAAALAVCGVPSVSLREVIAAERRSACWREAMAGAMVRVDDPLLLRAYHRMTDRKAFP
ncbi:UrcA family protein [Sphingomonas sp. RB3P16]|uniref:UrcA family protein n=1 Tax=Parasphingomonas frigoris TaxID=3096163 RepID=UPI002FC8C91B